jgi:O-antigen polymerase
MTMLPRSNPVSYVLPCLLFTLIIILLPSAYDPRLSLNTEISAAIFFFYALPVLAAATIVPFIWKRERMIAISRVDIALLLLLIFLLARLYLWQPYFGMTLQVRELLGLALLYVLLRTLPAGAFPFILLAIALSSLVQGVFGLMQLLNMARSRNATFIVTGNFFNPGPYSGFLAISGVLTVGMYLFRTWLTQAALSTIQLRHTRLRRLTYSLFHYLPGWCLIPVVILLPVLRSTAGWLGFIAGSLFLLACRYRWTVRFREWRRPWKVLLIVMMIAAGLTVLYLLYENRNDSADGRILVYKTSLDIAKSHPFFGVGFDRFRAYYMDAQALRLTGEKSDPESLLADDTYYAFSEPLQFLVENGLAGLLLISLVAILLSRIKAETDRLPLKQLLLGTLCTGFVFGLFAYPSYILSIKVILLTALALLVNIEKDKKLLRLSQQRATLIRALPLLVCGIAAGYGIETTRTQERAYRSWQLALYKYNQDAYSESVAGFQRAYPELRADGDYLMQYGKALAMSEQYGKAVTILESAKTQLNTTVIETTLGDSYKALGNIDAAEAAYLHAAAMIPVRFYPSYLLVKLYQQAGQNEKACREAKELMEKEVKIPSTAIKEMKQEIQEIIDSTNVYQPLKHQPMK